MTKPEYVAARNELGYPVKDWVKKLAISTDSHNSFMSERRLIPAYIAAHIITLLEHHRDR